MSSFAVVSENVITAGNHLVILFSQSFFSQSKED